MEQLIAQNPLLVIIAISWVVPWKGVALWKAARLNHRKWFIALLVVNTMAILDILYIYFFSKPRHKTAITISN